MTLFHKHFEVSLVLQKVVLCFISAEANSNFSVVDSLIYTFIRWRRAVLNWSFQIAVQPITQTSCHVLGIVPGVLTLRTVIFKKKKFLHILDLFLCQ